jgi:hypothetical protein
MGGRDFYCDLRPHSRYRTLFVDDELTPDVLPRSHQPAQLQLGAAAFRVLRLGSCG